MLLHPITRILFLDLCVQAFYERLALTFNQPTKKFYVGKKFSKIISLRPHDRNYTAVDCVIMMVSDNTIEFVTPYEPYEAGSNKPLVATKYENLFEIESVDISLTVFIS